MKVSFWIAGFCLIGQIVAGAAEPADLLSIGPGTVDAPDIVWSPNIPVVHEEITITARVRGKAPHPVPVHFVLAGPEVPPTELGAKPHAQPEEGGEYLDYGVSWQPSQAGIYQLTVAVDPGNVSKDPVTANNTVTLTLPVVWREIHVIPWGSTHHLKWVTSVAQEFPRGANEIPDLAYWHRRGIKVLGYMYTIEGNLMKLSEEEMVEAIVNHAGRYAEAGCEGLIIDETGSYGTPDGMEFIRRFGRAYDQVREKYPQLKVHNWIAGPLHREEIEIGARNDHLMMGESYEAIHARYGPTWREFLARRVERLGPRNILAVGVGGDCGRRFRPQIESSVRLCRTLGPDMPGMCYYGLGDLGEEEAYAGSFLEFVDNLTWNYFIKPVLTVPEDGMQVSPGTPKPGEAVSLRAELRNVGGIPARDVGVKIYARDLETHARTLLTDTVIPEIGNGMQDFVEEEPEPSNEMVIDGVRHPMGRFGQTSRVVMERVLVETPWTPERAGEYQLEIEIRPSDQYTLLNGLAQTKILVSAEPPPEPPAEVTVTEDDVWLSNYSPRRNEAIPVQVQVHNVSPVPVRNVGVRIFAYHLGTNRRTLLTHTVIPEIGAELQQIEEEDPPSLEHKMINGVKYPLARYGHTSIVLCTRALVDALWTPDQSGYYQIEVELQASPEYTLREGWAYRTVAVSE